MRSVPNCLVVVILSLSAGSLSANEPPVFRSGWTSMAKPAETIDCARQIGFQRARVPRTGRADEGVVGHD